MSRPRRPTDLAPDALADHLTAAITDHTARVAVVGQGYVGLSVAAAAARVGLDTVGIDLDPGRIASLRAGNQVVAGVDDELFAEAYATGRLTFSTDPVEIVDSDVVLICVPTPLIDHRPDLAAIEGAGAAVGQHLQPGTLVILESTTYPGTTEQVLQPLLEANGRRCGARCPARVLTRAHQSRRPRTRLRRRSPRGRRTHPPLHPGRRRRSTARSSMWSTR